MNRLYLLLSFIATLFLSYSCTEDALEPESHNYVSFTPDIVATRATDTYFETGDAISVYAFKGNTFKSSGNYADNIRYSYLNYKFIPAGEGIELDEDGLNYVALYPYSSDYSDSFKFSVSYDQSSYASYTSSDLMLATSMKSETAKEVTLNFWHILSKVVIDMSGEDLPSGDCSVTLNDVCYEATIDLVDMTYQTSETKSEILMCDDGNKRQKAILAPQVLEKGTIIGKLISNYSESDIRLYNDIVLDSGEEVTLYLSKSGNEYRLSTGKLVNEWFVQEVYLKSYEDYGIYEYNSAHVTWKGENIASIKYGMFLASASTTYSDSEIIPYLNEASQDYLDDLNSNGYLGIYYSDLDPDTEYEMISFATCISGNTEKTVMNRDIIRTAKRY